jgi:hypothetical protein
MIADTSGHGRLLAGGKQEQNKAHRNRATGHDEVLALSDYFRVTERY